MSTLAATAQPDMSTMVRVRGSIYDRSKPGWQQDPAHASRGTYLAEPKYAVPGFAVIDEGPKAGRGVFHVPTDGSPGVAVPAWSPATHARMPGLLNPSTSRFAKLADAKAFMLALSEACVLPVDRAAEREDVQRLADWLKVFIGL